MVGRHETGNETYILGLIKGLSQIEEPLELFVYHAGGFSDQGARSMHLRKLIGASPWSRLTVDLPLRALIDRVDVLHCTYVAPAWKHSPLVLTVHDISYEAHPEWFSARDLRVLKNSVPWSIHRADRVITVSEQCRKEIIQRYQVPEQKVVCVYNAAGPAAEPIDADEARTELSALGIDPSRRVVLAVGNLQPRKNLVRLISAFGRVAQDVPDADLVLVGPEHFRGDLVRQAGVALDSRVHFTGYLSDRQLAACYSIAAVFVFPSLYEGFGIPALEAMAHGAPVVCARAGALPEICAEAALYCDPLDEQSIADSLMRVLSDKALRESLSAAGFARQRTFTWAEAARQTLSVYRAALQQDSIGMTRG